MKTQPALSFFDRQSTNVKEQADDIIQQAFALAIDDVAQWNQLHGGKTKLTWSNFKNTRVNHLLRLGPLSESVSGGGSADAINALSRNHGPSWRMVVSLEPSGIRMWSTYPGGQSGNPGSIYYNNLIPSWEQGRHPEIKMLASPTDIAGKLYTLSIAAE